MTSHEGQDEPKEARGQPTRGTSNRQQQQQQQQPPTRPLQHRSRTASSALGDLHADPENSNRLDRIMTQLDDKGKAELADLAAQIATGAKRKGRVSQEEEYREQNPWYDQPKDKPLFSLGEPLPRGVRRGHGSGDEGGDEEAAAANERPNHTVFSLGEPLPRRIRRFNTGVTRDCKNEEDDLEQGLRRRPTRDAANRRDTKMDKQQRQQGQDTDTTLDPNRSDGTLAEPQHHPSTTSTQSDSSKDSQSAKFHRDEQTQGSDLARDFQIDADVIGGQHESDAVEQGLVDPNVMRNKWARLRAKYPEPLAEFLCTATSVFLGLTGTLSVNLSQNQSQQYGTYETLCWAWGLAFMFGIYLGGGVSGAHMNPIISVSLSIFRGFPWRRCIVYVLVQTFAAFAGAALAYALYADAIHQVDPELTSTYSSFFTVRKPWVSPATGFFNEFLGGAVIMVTVLSLGDDQNNPPGAGMHAFILGLLVTVLKMTLGYNTGAALSPASDLGPRLVAYAAGYKIEALWKTGWWFYGPWAGTMSGAIVGCTLYDAMVFVGSESPVNYRWSKERHVWRTLFHKKK